MSNIFYADESYAAGDGGRRSRFCQLQGELDMDRGEEHRELGGSANHRRRRRSLKELKGTWWGFEWSGGGGGAWLSVVDLNYIEGAILDASKGVVLIRDINQNIGEEDKWGGGCGETRGREWLKHMLRRLGLREVRSQGVWCSWSIGREGAGEVRERLDRDFANEAWEGIYPRAILNNLSIMRSDHGPLLLDMYPNQSRGVRLRQFEAFWVRYEAARLIVKRCWRENGDNTVLGLNRKSNSVFRHLWNWHSQSVGAPDRRIIQLMKEMGSRTMCF
ncbi:OLC1v1030502C1 [Oldenlandia corymbosa var. corymbosa]|uniref:OLC1v1030502C1 n=1 Tax=Oldenlandia corymbosa var. corymbosa TaxID=529605 RepID=A0AAV1CH22_OLDCO|nr:OLC1v1030502C1 [Oldenlandia corymbosa var. corymbosa]